MRPNIYGITEGAYEARWRRANEAITDIEEIARGTTGNGRSVPSIAEMEEDLGKIAKLIEPFASPPTPDAARTAPVDVMRTLVAALRQRYSYAAHDYGWPSVEEFTTRAGINDGVVKQYREAVAVLAAYDALPAVPVRGEGKGGGEQEAEDGGEPG